MLSFFSSFLSFLCDPELCTKLDVVIGAVVVKMANGICIALCARSEAAVANDTPALWGPRLTWKFSVAASHQYPWWGSKQHFSEELQRCSKCAIALFCWTPPVYHRLQLMFYKLTTMYLLTPQIPLEAHNPTRDHCLQSHQPSSWLKFRPGHDTKKQDSHLKRISRASKEIGNNTQRHTILEKTWQSHTTFVKQRQNTLSKVQWMFAYVLVYFFCSILLKPSHSYLKLLYMCWHGICIKNTIALWCFFLCASRVV